MYTFPSIDSSNCLMVVLPLTYPIRQRRYMSMHQIISIYLSVYAVRIHDEMGKPYQNNSNKQKIDIKRFDTNFSYIFFFFFFIAISKSLARAHGSETIFGAEGDESINIYCSVCKYDPLKNSIYHAPYVSVMCVCLECIMMVYQPFENQRM